jgi:hypothetical protein
VRKNSTFGTEIIRNDAGKPAASSTTRRSKLAPRRSFLQGLGLASAALTTGALFPTAVRASGQMSTRPTKPTQGDIAILQLLAVAELIETDLWQQYAELGGLTPGQLPVEIDTSFVPMNNYQAAFMNLDFDGPQYVSSNTLDELSHATFLNAYLESLGAAPVNLDRFRVLPSSQADGAQQIGRLTNLTKLTVDTSWFTRYHSTTNPDFGASFAQALPALAAGKFTAIPRNNTDFTDLDHIQVIANTAAFHFGFIEQGGSSLYAAMSMKVASTEALQITIGIGGDEIAHFLEWVDFAGNGVQPGVAPVSDPTNGLTFPNFDATVDPLLQTNLIFPVPAQFIDPSLPLCATIRPITSVGVTALDAISSLIDDGLFIGQSLEFLKTLIGFAVAADNA